jgi:hypothetical protein
MHKLATRLEFQLLIGYGFRFEKLKMIQRKIGWCGYSLYWSMLNLIARTITKYKTFSWLFLEEFLNHWSVCYSISIRIWNCAPRKGNGRYNTNFLLISGYISIQGGMLFNDVNSTDFFKMFRMNNLRDLIQTKRT